MSWTDEDQEQLQEELPPPITALKISRHTGEVVGVVDDKPHMSRADLSRWMREETRAAKRRLAETDQRIRAARMRMPERAPKDSNAGTSNRPSRPGRGRTISRQAHSRSTRRRGPPASESDEPPPAAQPQRPGDEQDRGTVSSRPRRTRGDLTHVGELLTPLMRRLLGDER